MARTKNLGPVSQHHRSVEQALEDRRRPIASHRKKRVAERASRADEVVDLRSTDDPEGVEDATALVHPEGDGDDHDGVAPAPPIIEDGGDDDDGVAPAPLIVEDDGDDHDGVVPAPQMIVDSVSTDERLTDPFPDGPEDITVLVSFGGHAVVHVWNEEPVS